MNPRITELLAQMAALEAEMRSAVHDQESRMFFQIKGRRVEFERTVRDAHRKLKKNFYAHKVLGTHKRYNRFLDYGDAQNYEARLEEFRVALGKVKPAG